MALPRFGKAIFIYGDRYYIPSFNGAAMAQALVFVVLNPWHKGHKEDTEVHKANAIR